LAAEGNIVTFGVAPVRVDFINEIDGVTFEHARAGRITGRYGGIDVHFIGKDDLIANKKATPRAR
jgi:hypothetical protein